MNPKLLSKLVAGDDCAMVCSLEHKHQRSLQENFEIVELNPVPAIQVTPPDEQPFDGGGGDQQSDT